LGALRRFGLSKKFDLKNWWKESDNISFTIWNLNKIRHLNSLDYAWDWVRDYLRTNPEVEGSDRALCDNIGR
jgi:hypothetical protein